jgi:hypothetical protein
VRRHPIAMALVLLLVVSAVFSLPAIVDTVTGAPPGDAELTRPFLYVLLAPASDLLDALTFLSIDRAWALLGEWTLAAILLGALLPGTRRRRIIRSVAGVSVVAMITLATLILPRPVPRLESNNPNVTIIDFHAHTDSSHDGRHGWSLQDLAAWHADQGFQASYVTDHNVVFSGHSDQPIPLLPGVEWSVYRQHIVAVGEVAPLDRTPFSRDTPGMLGIFAALHRQGALGLASIPEYWENHREELDQFVAAGVDGFEIVNCSPKALAFPSSARRDVIDLARSHDLLVTGASDNHGWGKVTCVWNLALPGARGFGWNHVVARPIALLQADMSTMSAGVTQLWLMLRGLTWPERVSWLTWIALVTIYRAVPRRRGQGAGFGILARSLVTPPRPDSEPQVP